MLHPQKLLKSISSVSSVEGRYVSDVLMQCFVWSSVNSHPFLQRCYSTRLLSTNNVNSRSVLCNRTYLGSLRRNRCTKLGLLQYARTSQCCRFYSDDKDDEVKPVVKVFFFRLPTLQWIRDSFYMFFMRNWVDSSFCKGDFVVGAKQALSFLTRLAVLKDFEAMKDVATDKVVKRMKDIIYSLPEADLQSAEILVNDITLATANFSSISKLEEPGAYQVEMKVTCVALKTFKSQPLCVVIDARFRRCYHKELDADTDWYIEDIIAIQIRDLEDCSV